MKRAILILGLIIVIIFTFAGCTNDPYIEIRHSGFNFDERNIYLNVENIYETDYYNPYDWVDTENGKDLIIHYIEIEEE